MPLISRELKITFDSSSSYATRRANVVPRDGFGNDITPHFLMLPQGTMGCSFEIPTLHPDTSGILDLIEGRAIVRVPVTTEMGFEYSVQFKYNLEPTGVMAWPIRHPTERITITFNANEHETFPQYWIAELLREGRCGHLIDIERYDGVVIICIDKPTLGSTLQISWSQEPFEC